MTEISLQQREQLARIAMRTELENPQVGESVELFIRHHLEEIAPSTELRKEFNHQTEYWLCFEQKYYQELDSNSHVNELREMEKYEMLTLLYAAKDLKINHALVLKNYVLGKKIET